MKLCQYFLHRVRPFNDTFFCFCFAIAVAVTVVVAAIAIAIAIAIAVTAVVAVVSGAALAATRAPTVLLVAGGSGGALDRTVDRMRCAAAAAAEGIGAAERIIV
jgi:hypothetical protein